MLGPLSNFEIGRISIFFHSERHPKTIHKDFSLNVQIPKLPPLMNLGLCMSQFGHFALRVFRTWLSSFFVRAFLMKVNQEKRIEHSVIPEASISIAKKCWEEYNRSNY